MRFYKNQHQFYARIGLHARQMFVCIIDFDGNISFHKNMSADPTHLLRAIQTYKDDIIIGLECVFTWYWIADFCVNNNIPFILGNALYMKAIYGGKTKNDEIDSPKIASMIGSWYRPDSCSGNPL